MRNKYTEAEIKVLLKNLCVIVDTREQVWSNIEEYLKEDDVVNYGNENIKRLADTLYQGTSDEVEYIKKAYEYVRDQISHSADIKEDAITCSASEVLEAGHGICFAKSHLLAALLRYKTIPTGFCYQKLILDDERRRGWICDLPRPGCESFGEV